MRKVCRCGPIATPAKIARSGAANHTFGVRRRNCVADRIGGPITNLARAACAIPPNPAINNGLCRTAGPRSVEGYLAAIVESSDAARKPIIAVTAYGGRRS